MFSKNTLLYVDIISRICEKHLYLNEVLLLGAKDVGYPRQRFQSITNKRLMSKYCSLLFCNPKYVFDSFINMQLNKPDFAKFSSDSYYICAFLIEISRIKALHAKYLKTPFNSIIFNISFQLGV